MPDDDLTIDELADGIALWQEHQPQTREDWLRIAQRWHAKGLEAPDDPSAMFGALYDAWGEVERLRAACRRAHEQLTKFDGKGPKQIGRAMLTLETAVPDIETPEQGKRSHLMKAPTPQLRSCERVTVSRIVLLEGEGVKGDPCRLVTYLYDDDGTLLVRNDPTET